MSVALVTTGTLMLGDTHWCGINVTGYRVLLVVWLFDEMKVYSSELFVRGGQTQEKVEGGEGHVGRG